MKKKNKNKKIISIINFYLVRGKEYIQYFFIYKLIFE